MSHYPGPTLYRLAPLLSALLVSSCALSSRDFVDQSLGFSVTKGSVTQIDGFSSEGKNYLADGVALTISRDGGKVSLALKERQVMLECPRGSILVLAEDGDYLLRPLSPGEAGDSDPSEPSDDDSSPEGGS